MNDEIESNDFPRFDLLIKTHSNGGESYRLIRYKPQIPLLIKLSSDNRLYGMQRQVAARFNRETMHPSIRSPNGQVNRRTRPGRETAAQRPLVIGYFSFMDRCRSTRNWPLSARRKFATLCGGVGTFLMQIDERIVTECWQFEYVRSDLWVEGCWDIGNFADTCERCNGETCFVRDFPLYGFRVEKVRCFVWF